MKVLNKLRNYFFYCGIEKDEYNALKKDAYVSNFETWRVLHAMMAAVFAILVVGSLSYELMAHNRMLYLTGFVYSLVALVLFFILKKDSLAAQLLIYLTMSLLFLFACFLTQNNPEIPAVSFIVFLLITPMFMIDKPFFMAIELTAASVVFLTWMHGVKPIEIWKIDHVNVVTYTIVGILLNVIANSLRIREFVLTRELDRQKDTDELTGLKNKGALTRAINNYMAEEDHGKGIMFLMDVDLFKHINDTYGHDCGDLVISRLGAFLGKKFADHDIVGRFGGDEFLVFVKDENNIDTACRLAEEIIAGAAEIIILPDENKGVSVSVGVAIYDGHGEDYSVVFKEVDIALYKAKANTEKRYFVYEG